METLNKTQSEDGELASDSSPTQPVGSAVMVEVVEMAENMPVASFGMEIFGDLNSRTEDGSPFDGRRVLKSTSYDKCEREKKVSKYQRKRKLKPSTSFSTDSNTSCREQTEIKREDSVEQTSQDRLDSQESYTVCSNEIKVEGIVMKEELDGIQTAFSLDLKSGENVHISSRQLNLSHVESWMENLPVSSTVEEGQDYLDGSSTDKHKTNYDGTSATDSATDQVPALGDCVQFYAEYEDHDNRWKKPDVQQMSSDADSSIQLRYNKSTGVEKSSSAKNSVSARGIKIQSDSGKPPVLVIGKKPSQSVANNDMSVINANSPDCSESSAAQAKSNVRVYTTTYFSNQSFPGKRDRPDETDCSFLYRKVVKPTDKKNNSPCKTLKHPNMEVIPQNDSGIFKSRVSKTQVDAVPSTSDKGPIFSMNRCTLGHSSELVSHESEYGMMECEILPQIKSSGHLGLSSHSETDWSIDEVEEPNNLDEDNEDADVLSLYEYDTFSEIEDGADDGKHVTHLTTRNLSKGKAFESKRGESLLPLGADEDLSISIKDNYERQVSRSVSKNHCLMDGHLIDQKDKLERDTKKSSEKDCLEKHGTGTEDTVYKVQGLNEQTRELKDNMNAEQKRKAVFSSDTKNAAVKSNEDEKFQVPKVAALSQKNMIRKSAQNINQRQSEIGVRGRFPQNNKYLIRPGMDLPYPRKPLNRSDDRGQRFREQNVQLASFQKMQCSMDETTKELEMELKFAIEKKDIFAATKIVGKIHQHEDMKIDRETILNLLHLFIREGAAPQLMHIFTFICNQGLFNAEVCNAYLRLGCGQSARFDRHLKNIFQYLQKHSIKTAGDCMINLLRVYSEHKGEPMLFWMMLTYFEKFPSFSVPVPMLKKAILKVLDHRDRKALSRLNQWVLTTKSVETLKKLDLSLMGKMAPVMLPPSLSRLQKFITGSEKENQAEDVEDVVPAAEDVILTLPKDFSDQDFQYYGQCIQDLGAKRDFVGVARMFAKLSKNHGHSRPLLKEFAQVLLEQDVVLSVDTFLRHLYKTYAEECVETIVNADKLAVAHLAAIIVDCVHLSCNAETTVAVFEVMAACPLVVKTLFMNCRECGYRIVTSYLQCQNFSQAVDCLKVLRLRQDDEKGSSLVKDLMQQLVAACDIPSAYTVFSIAVSRNAIGFADVGSLISQLMWHALNVGNTEIALSVLDVGQSLSTSFPSPLLRGLLVACFLSCYDERVDFLFELLKRGKVYNAENLQSSSPYVFHLSTMLTPAEIRLCLLDRLKELYHKVCAIVTAGSTLSSMEKSLAIQILPEHEPQFLALPFLALAPRSVEQAVDVVRNELKKISPPVNAAYNKQLKLLTLEPESLVSYLKNYDSTCLKQELSWKDDIHPRSQSSVQEFVPQQRPPQPPQPIADRQKVLTNLPGICEQPIQEMRWCSSEHPSRQPEGQRNFPSVRHNEFAKRPFQRPLLPTPPIISTPASKQLFSGSHSISPVQKAHGSPDTVIGEPSLKKPKLSPPTRKITGRSKSVELHDKNCSDEQGDGQHRRLSPRYAQKQPSSFDFGAKKQQGPTWHRGARQSQVNKCSGNPWKNNQGHGLFGKKSDGARGKLYPGSNAKQMRNSPPSSHRDIFPGNCETGNGQLQKGSGQLEPHGLSPEAHLSYPTGPRQSTNIHKHHSDYLHCSQYAQAQQQQHQRKGSDFERQDIQEDSWDQTVYQNQLSSSSRRREPFLEEGDQFHRSFDHQQQTRDTFKQQGQFSDSKHQGMAKEQLRPKRWPPVPSANEQDRKSLYQLDSLRGSFKQQIQDGHPGRQSVGVEQSEAGYVREYAHLPPHHYTEAQSGQFWKPPQDPFPGQQQTSPFRKEQYGFIQSGIREEIGEAWVKPIVSRGAQGKPRSVHDDYRLASTQPGQLRHVSEPDFTPTHLLSHHADMQWERDRCIEQRGFYNESDRQHPMHFQNTQGPRT